MARTRARIAIERYAFAVRNAAVALLISIVAASAATADQFLEGDAACDGISMCSITNIDPVTSPIGSERIVIMIRDMMHIEVFDMDGFSWFAQYGVGNPNDESVNLQFEYAFLDMSGNPVGPDLFDPEAELGPMEGIGNPLYSVGAPDGGSFIFHGFEIGITCEACGESTLLNLGQIVTIEVRDVDETSRVGMWVPEPSTALLLSVGAVTLFGRRRRQALR